MYIVIEVEDAYADDPTVPPLIDSLRGLDDRQVEMSLSKGLLSLSGTVVQVSVGHPS